MARTPNDFQNFPPILERITTAPGCPYGPYRAVSRYDPRWDDGDTTLVMLDPGMDNYPVASVRLLGVNAPEKTTPEGKALQAYMAEEVIPSGTPLVLVTSWNGKSLGRDKYGRLLAVMFRESFRTKTPDDRFNPFSVNLYLHQTRLAEAYIDFDLMRSVSQGVFDLTQSG